ncbi:TauD/TfdA family dioxygenase [Actinoplanes sp. NBRC 103695]|uniref:TauD/TfdA family dioxygenase n=1 Tax=Actinoplanes sp. NBRC 103695 TaxID=3032202 RepID=UPI0024A50326|nr:TauD/TfdA family dioxygenase [Actinoplanes sp. NBRC 103695]GLY96561.1 L-asparagine oxygenase [Actinoplanes sp. NBRC 103695]
MELDKNSLTLELDEIERAQIGQLADGLAGLDPVSDPDRFVLEAQMLAAEVPARIRRRLLQFRRFGSDSGGFLLRGLPLGEVPPTPQHGDLGSGVRLTAAAALSIVAAHLGEQFGFRPELSGLMVQDIVPVDGFEDTQQSISSRSLLELHTETAFTEYRADFIGLLCVRADPDAMAGTLLSPIGTVLTRLDPADVEILRQPQFSTTVDASFLRGCGADGPIVVQPIRVLTGSSAQPRLRCDFAEVRGLDARSDHAVRRLHEAASETATEVRLRDGDLLFVDNHQAFHGRTPFARHGDGTDRWLLRSFIARDLARSVADRPGDGRIIDIDYSSAE